MREASTSAHQSSNSKSELTMLTIQIRLSQMIYFGLIDFVSRVLPPGDSSGMIYQEFNEALLEAIDYAFSSLGESCRRALYFHLKTTFRLPRRQIPERLDEFDEALKTIFKSGATFLEKLILKKLCEMLGVSAVEDDALNFVESISMIRSISSSSVTLVPDFREVTSTPKKTRR